MCPCLWGPSPESLVEPVLFSWLHPTPLQQQGHLGEERGLGKRQGRFGTQMWLVAVLVAGRGDRAAPHHGQGVKAALPGQEGSGLATVGFGHPLEHPP